jgi:hypothetical protein
MYSFKPSFSAETAVEMRAHLYSKFEDHIICSPKPSFRDENISLSNRVQYLEVHDHSRVRYRDLLLHDGDEFLTNSGESFNFVLRRSDTLLLQGESSKIIKTSRRATTQDQKRVSVPDTYVFKMVVRSSLITKFRIFEKNIYGRTIEIL